MAKRNKIKSARPLLKLEALEQRQLLAGGFTAAQGTEYSDIVAPNGNVYDQVLMKTSAISVSNDANQITRVSFLDLQGDIVQAEFSGAGTLSISLESATGPAAPTLYAQSDVSYMSGLASFTIQGSDSTTNFTLFSVGSNNAHRGADNPIFAGGLGGGNNTADVARLTIVSNPGNPNGSAFGAISAGNAIFSNSSGVTGISATGVQVQDFVRVGNINATGSATPTLIFGANSQFGGVTVAGGGLLSDNGAAINNTGSYAYGITLAAGTNSAGVVDAAETASTQTFTANNALVTAAVTKTLTISVDNGAAFIGGINNDTFNALATGTFNALDSLDGGAGTDTLNVIDNAAAVATAGRTVTNIETATLASSSTVTADTTAWTGLTTLTATGTGGVNVTAASTTTITASNTGAQAMAIIGGGGSGVLTLANGAGAVTVGATVVANALTAVSVTGGSTIAITDRSGAAAVTGSTLKTVSVVGAATSDDLAITANGLTTLNLTTMTGATTVGDVTVTAAAATRALAVNLNGMDTAADGAATTAASATITDATATSVAYTSVTAASYDITAVHAAATSATIDAGVALQMDALTGVLITTLGISGAARTTIAADTLASTVVVTSTSTGGVTLTQALTANQRFVGTDSSGTDYIELATTYAKAVTTGGGNDTVIINGAFASTGSVDAGDGTADVLSLTVTLAANNSLSASTTFGGLISNFEVLSLSTSAVKTIDMANLDNIPKVISAVAVANATAFDNFANNGTMQFNAANSAGTTINVLDAALAGHNSDATSLVLNSTTLAGTIAYNTVTIDNVETININSSGSGTMVSLDTNTLSLVAGHAVSIYVTGSVDLNLTSALTAATLQLIDGTANTNGLIASTAGATQGVTIKGSLTAANNLTGGAGADAITGGSGVDGITGGAGADVIDGAAGIDTISGGDGADTITGGAGADIITGGAGNDAIVLTETTAAIDKVVFTGGVDTAANQLVANGKDTITGWGSTDTFNVAALGDGTTGAGMTAITAAAAAGAFTDDSSVVISTNGTAANLTTAGTAAVTDWTNMTQVSAYLSERFTSALTSGGVFVINDTTASANTSYVYTFVDVGTTPTSIAAAEIALVGVISNSGTALTAANIVYA